MTRGWGIATAIFFVIVVPGGIYAGLGIYMLLQIDYKMVGYKLKSWNLQGAEIDFAVNVINPSALDVHIYGYDIDVSINGGLVANIKSTTKKTLVGKTTSTLTIPVSVNFKKSFSSLKSQELITYFATSNFEKIVVNLKGKLKGKLLGVTVSAPLDINYSLKEIIDINTKPDTKVAATTTTATEKTVKVIK